VRRLPIVVLLLAVAAILLGMVAPAGAQNGAESQGTDPEAAPTDSKVSSRRSAGSSIRCWRIHRSSIHAAEWRLRSRAR
jgi:hypothetical protein